jgi:hypothetical protein
MAIKEKQNNSRDNENILNDGGASNKRAKKAAEKGTKSATKQQVADFVANTEKGGGDSSKNNEDSP